MNKKEISEIKKQFSPNNCAMNRKKKVVPRNFS